MQEQSCLAKERIHRDAVDAKGLRVIVVAHAVGGDERQEQGLAGFRHPSKGGAFVAKLRRVGFVDHELGVAELHFAEIHAGILTIDDEIDLRALVTAARGSMMPGTLLRMYCSDL